MTAIFAVTASVGLLETYPQIDEAGWGLLLVGAVVLSSAVGGFGPGVATVVWSVGLVVARAGGAPAGADLIRLALFVTLGLTIAVTSQLLRREARRRELWIAQQARDREWSRRREAERVLQESDRRLRSLVASNVLGVVFFDDDVVLDANQAFLDMLGITREALVGKRQADLTLPEDRPRDQAAGEALRREGRLTPYEKRFLRVDGSPHHALVAGTRIEEDPSRWIAFVVDTERRKRAEAEREELLGREQSARRAAEIAAAHASFLANATATLASSLEIRPTLQRVVELTIPHLADFGSIELVGADGEIERVAAAQAPAYEAALGKRIWSFVPTAGATENPVVKALRTGKTEWLPWATDDWNMSIATAPEHMELLREVGPRSFVCVPILLRSRVFGVLTLCLGAKAERIYSFTEVGVAQELAARIAIAIESSMLFAEAGEARREAEAASRAREIFLATLSHELRTPMNTVSILINLMQAGRLPESRRTEAFETIQRNLRVQLRLLEDLLDTSRIISGKLQIELQPTSLTKAVARAIASVQPSLEPREQRIDAHGLDSEIGIRGDPERLQQVLVNLLGNAVKFSPESATIHVRLAREGARAIVEVRDEGIGISPDLLPKVFEPFRQADGRSNEGLGLGLAIAHRIVTMHGGELHVSSAGEGLGATFMVLLPLFEGVAVSPDDEARPLEELSSGADSVKKSA